MVTEQAARTNSSQHGTAARPPLELPPRALYCSVVTGSGYKGTKQWSCSILASFSNIPSSHHVWCENCLIPQARPPPLVNHPPQFGLYVVSSIHSVSDTKPRSTHRADAQRLVAPRP
eukprot:2677041-Pleurochrysis_carterae.AAC.1